MNSNLETIFNEAEKRYLTTDELGTMGNYVDSLPTRLSVYRWLRDQEVELLQTVADQLQQEYSQASVPVMEQCIKNGVLALRSCAMAMLMLDDNYVHDRVSWLKQSQQNYQSQEMDASFYRLLDKQLSRLLNTQQLSLLQPSLNVVQNVLGDRARAVEASENLSVSSLF
ncbi:globin family protein [Prochlorothrix hollandica]|uniref:Phycobilisome protein n=1 Tax=Prochlorothrix hollandica PCC 9006 = CALU 1027 TaxID=317619 RepID=A0A0M2PT87_PROHO|nr:hypothetical protein [Prochlorothrix hollandica]KKI99319.1 hypothetical protein PROH_16550 [Prochlorothrix hollandica PCC 9006 = CALU 1027]